jgi:hypothetical protein
VGANTWQQAPTLNPLDPPSGTGIGALVDQHSITWSDSVSPARYFVADTRGCDNDGRIVSFESLSDPDIYSDTDTIGGIDLSRPHDLEFNPEDDYFYGVTAPLADCDSASAKVLFRFKDIGVEEGTLDLGGERADDEFYMRSVTIVNGIVYAVNSFGPEVIRIDDFEHAQTTVYTADSSFSAQLQGIEFHNGWWYGTGDNLGGHGPMLARWRNWDEFESGTWEDLSHLIYPDEGSISISGSRAYFLTRWNGRLFFTVYDSNEFDRQDRVYEVVAPRPPPIPAFSRWHLGIMSVVLAFFGALSLLARGAKRSRSAP